MFTPEQLRQLKNYPNSLYYDLQAQFLFHSNKIEGSTFSLEQLDLLLDKRIVSGEHSWEDVLETKNSIDVFEYVIDSLDYPLSSSFILDLHKLLKRNTRDESVGQAGVWKNIPNSLRGTDIELAQPWEVPHKISELLEWWQVSDKSLEAVCEFHARFELIHPFLDGNGRVGRFIILHQCLSQGMIPVVIDSHNANEYRSALGDYQQGKDSVRLLQLFKEAQEQFANKPIVKQTKHVLSHSSSFGE